MSKHKYMKKIFILTILLVYPVVTMAAWYDIFNPLTWFQENSKSNDESLTLGVSDPVSFTKSLWPIQDSVSELGTSTKAYLRLTTDEICLNGDCQTAWSAGGGEANTGASLGTGLNIFDSKVGTALRFNSIAAGSNITLSTSTNSNTIVISSTGGSGGSGTISTSSPLVSGQSVYATGVNTIASIGTGTISVPTGLTGTANRYVIGGNFALGLDTGYVIPLQSTLDGKINVGTTSVNSITTLNNLSITKSQVSDFGTYENPLTFTFPLSRSSNTISFNGLGTTTNSGLSQGFLYVGSGGLFQTVSSSTALASKQDTLVSGTNIKTINGSSVLGSGDLVVGGGYSYLYQLLDTTISTTTASSTGAMLVYSTSTNKWISKNPMQIDVRDFGANFNDANDDYTAIQSALDYAFLMGGGVVNLPTGTGYLSTSTVIYTGTTLRGQGSQTTILRSLTTTGDLPGGSLVRSGISSDFITVEGIKLLGHSGTGGTTGSGLVFPAGGVHSEIRIRDVDIRNFPDDGIYLDDPILCQVEDSYVRDSGRDGISVNLGTTCTFTSNYTTGNDRYGINLLNHTTATLNNHASEYNTKNFRIQGGGNHTLNSPYVEISMNANSCALGEVAAYSFQSTQNITINGGYSNSFAYLDGCPAYHIESVGVLGLQLNNFRGKALTSAEGGLGEAPTNTALIDGTSRVSSEYLNFTDLIGGGISGTLDKVIATSTGYFGIGTSTPNSLLSIGNTNGINFSTATSSFSSTGGINLASGCFAINGTCISGGSGGGGSAAGTWSTTTSLVSGQLINYPNNTTDIVTVGSNATTSAEVYFDPNAQRYQIGNASTASTTITGTLNVTGNVNMGQLLKIESASGNPEFDFTEGGTVRAKTYYDLTNDRLTFQNNQNNNADAIYFVDPLTSTGAFTLQSTLGVTGLSSFVNASSTLFSTNYASSTVGYFGTAFIPNLGTAAGSFLAVDPNGQIIATTTPSGGGSASSTLLADTNSWSGTNRFSNASSTLFSSDYASSTLGLFGNVGIGTTGAPSGGKLQIIQSVDTNAGGLTISNVGASASNRIWMDSTGNARLDAGGTAGGLILFNGAGTGNAAIGTTTSQIGKFTSFSSTAPQLSLSAGAGLAQWVFRNAGGNLYLSTTTVAGTATTTTSALSILNSGEVIVRNLFQIFNVLGTKVMDVAGNVVTLLGAWDFGGADSLEIPNGTNPTTDATGEIAWDTTSGNLEIATSTGHVVIGSATTTIFSSVGTTTGIVSGLVQEIPPHPLQQVVTSVWCKVTSGTSLQVYLSDGTNNTNTITCTTTGTQYAITTNNTWTSYETMQLVYGTKTGNTGDIVLRAMGYRISD